MGNHKKILSAIITAFLIALSSLYLCAIGPYWNITPDSAAYVLGAKSLAAGHGYLLNGRPITTFFPGTSLIFGVSLLFFPNNYLILNAIVKIFALLSIYLCFVLFKKEIGNINSLIIALLCAGSTSLFFESTRLLSDIFYMFFSLLAIVIAKGIEAKDRNWLNWFFAGAIVFAACMIRIAGLALAAAVLFYSLNLLIKKKGKENLAPIVTMLIIIMSAFLMEYRFSSIGTSHTEIFFQKEAYIKESGSAAIGDFIERFPANLSCLSDAAKDIVTNKIFIKLPRNFSLIKNSLEWLVLTLFILGLGVSLRTGPTIVNLYVFIYLFFTLSLSFRPVPRYLIPLLPFLFYFIFKGIKYIYSKIRPFTGTGFLKLVNLGAAVYIIFCIWQGTNYILKNIPKQHRSDFGVYPIKCDNPDLQRLGMWLRENMPSEDAYICERPLVMDLITERRGCSFPKSKDHDKLMGLLRARRIKYILVDKVNQATQQFLIPAIENNPGKFILIQDEKKASLYAFQA